ncbi:Hypothetical predicted protein, partial [Marmota monax]
GSEVDLQRGSPGAVPLLSTTAALSMVGSPAPHLGLLQQMGLALPISPPEEGTRPAVVRSPPED